MLDKAISTWPGVIILFGIGVILATHGAQALSLDQGMFMRLVNLAQVISGAAFALTAAVSCRKLFSSGR